MIRVASGTRAASASREAASPATITSASPASIASGRVTRSSRLRAISLAAPSAQVTSVAWWPSRSSCSASAIE